jgi:hypothetical protein
MNGTIPQFFIGAEQGRQTTPISFPPILGPFKCLPALVLPLLVASWRPGLLNFPYLTHPAFWQRVMAFSFRNALVKCEKIHYLPSSLVIYKSKHISTVLFYSWSGSNSDMLQTEPDSDSCNGCCVKTKLQTKERLCLFYNMVLLLYNKLTHEILWSIIYATNTKKNLYWQAKTRTKTVILQYHCMW